MVVARDALGKGTDGREKEFEVQHSNPVLYGTLEPGLGFAK